MSEDKERSKLRPYAVIASPGSGDTVICDPIEVSGISNLNQGQVTISSIGCTSVDVNTDVDGNWKGTLSGCAASSTVVITATPTQGGSSSSVTITCDDEAPITEEGGEDDDESDDEERCVGQSYKTSPPSIVRILYNAKNDSERLIFVLLPEYYDTNKSVWMLIKNQSKVFEIDRHMQAGSGRRTYRAEFKLNALKKTDRVRMILCDSAGKLTQYTVFGV